MTEETGPINKNYEQVYCVACCCVTPCQTHRLIDGWEWICSVCGSLAEQEFDMWDDDYDDDDDDDWDDDDLRV